MDETADTRDDHLAHQWLVAAGVPAAAATAWITQTPLTVQDDRLVVRGADGEPLVELFRGNPRPPGDGLVHSYSQGPAVLIWMLSAVASGVLGNTAYDTLKKAFAAADTILQRHSAGEPASSTAHPRDPATFMFRYWFLADAAVLPGQGLRAALVTIAQETIEAYNAALPGTLDVDWSQTLVFLISDTTWTVEVNLAGSHRVVAIEIDLTPDEPLAHPIRVFPPWG